jgi:mannan endo-1,6-alpha-mannosidase
VNATFDTFAPATYNNTLTEACEPTEVCNRNDILFKGLTAGWLAFVSLIVPSTYNQILPQLQTSAQGAAESCTGAGNDTCGVKWYTGTWDDEIGLEEQMSALNIFWSILISRDNASAYAPLTAFTGGNSNTSTGTGSSDTDPSTSTTTVSQISTADRAGAGILTAIFAMGVMGAVYWMVATT